MCQELVSRCSPGAWGLPWPSASRRPQDSQTDTDWQEAGYPQGNPSSCLGDPGCRLLLNSAGNQAGSLLWEDGAGFHGNPQLPHPSLEGRKKASRNSSRNISVRLLLWWGKALMIPVQIRDALSLRLDSHLVFFF